MRVPNATVILGVLIAIGAVLSIIYAALGICVMLKTLARL